MTETAQNISSNSNLIPGFATADATKSWADMMWKLFPRISPDAWRLFEGGSTIGKVGLGTYRMGGMEQQEEAIRNAILEGGVNLFETANTYMDGAAEKLLGKVLGGLMSEGRIQREQMVLVSKAGYIQGQLMQHYKANPPPETVQKTEGLWHCINPSFLKEQLDASCQALGVASLDAYLLHNPEYFLEQSVQLGIDLGDARYRYYERIERAFVFLEEAVRDGKIGCYGLSSNTLVIPSEDQLFTDLAEVFAAAQRAAKKVHGEGKRPKLRVIQFPLNLLEMSALHLKNTTYKLPNGEEEPVSTLELASRMKLTVLTNRPLNAFPYHSPATRLAGKGHAKTSDEKIKDALRELTDIERRLKGMLGGWPEFDGKPIFSFLNEEETIKNKRWTQNGSLDFEPIKYQRLLPETTGVAKLIFNLKAHRPDRREELENMLATYQENALKIIDGLRHQARGFDVERNGQIEKFLRDRLPEDWAELPMQQIALHTVASIPGVTCVLCGLREPEYIYDVMETYKRANFPDIAQIVGGE